MDFRSRRAFALPYSGRVTQTSTHPRRRPGTRFAARVAALRALCQEPPQARLRRVEAQLRTARRAALALWQLYEDATAALSRTLLPERPDWRAVEQAAGAMEAMWDRFHAAERRARDPRLLAKVALLRCREAQAHLLERLGGEEVLRRWEERRKRAEERLDDAEPAKGKPQAFPATLQLNVARHTPLPPKLAGVAAGDILDDPSGTLLEARFRLAPLPRRTRAKSPTVPTPTSHDPSTCSQENLESFSARRPTHCETSANPNSKHV